MHIGSAPPYIDRHGSYFYRGPDGRFYIFYEFGMSESGCQYSDLIHNWKPDAFLVPAHVALPAGV